MNVVPSPTRLSTSIRSAVILDDPVADREAQTRALALRFGREEGVEDAVQLVLGYAGAVVADADARQLALRACAIRIVPCLSIASQRSRGDS